MEDLCLELGHPIITPNGTEIRVPFYVFKRIKRLGCLTRGEKGEPPVISGKISKFLKSEYESLTGGLLRVLGNDCSGPMEVDCDCEDCKKLKEPDEKDPPEPRRTINNNFQNYVVSKRGIR